MDALIQLAGEIIGAFLKSLRLEEKFRLYKQSSEPELRETRKRYFIFYLFIALALLGLFIALLVWAM